MVHHCLKTQFIPVMKAKTVLFFVTVFSLFLGGCMHPPAFITPNRTTVRGGNTVYDGVVVGSKGTPYGHSRDSVTFVNKSDGFVDVLLKSRLVISGIKPGEQITLHTRPEVERENMMFSTVVYTINPDGTRSVVKSYNDFVRFGGRREFVTAIWEVGEKNLRRSTRYSRADYYSLGY